MGEVQLEHGSSDTSFLRSWMWKRSRQQTEQFWMLLLKSRIVLLLTAFNCCLD